MERAAAIRLNLDYRKNDRTVEVTPEQNSLGNSLQAARKEGE